MKCKVFSKDLDLQNPNPPTIEKLSNFSALGKNYRKTIEFFGAETIETIEKTIEKKRSDYNDGLQQFPKISGELSRMHPAG